MATYTMTPDGERALRRQMLGPLVSVLLICLLLSVGFGLLCMADREVLEPGGPLLLWMAGALLLVALCVAIGWRYFTREAELSDEALTLRSCRDQTLPWDELADVQVSTQNDSVTLFSGHRCAGSLTFSRFAEHAKGLALELDQRLAPWRERRIAEFIEGHPYRAMHPMQSFSLGAGVTLGTLIAGGLIYRQDPNPWLLAAMLCSPALFYLMIAYMFGGLSRISISSAGVRQGRRQLRWSDLERLELRFPREVVLVGPSARVTVSMLRLSSPAMLELLVRQAPQAEVVDLSTAAPPSLLRAGCVRLFGAQWDTTDEAALRRSPWSSLQLPPLQVNWRWVTLGIVLFVGVMLAPIAGLVGWVSLEQRKLVPIEAVVVSTSPLPDHPERAKVTVSYHVAATPYTSWDSMPAAETPAAGTTLTVMVNPVEPQSFWWPSDVPFPRELLPFVRIPVVAVCGFGLLLFALAGIAVWRAKNLPKPWRLAGR